MSTQVMMMQITYDKRGDVMYIKLNEETVKGAWPVDDLVNIYYTEDDRIAGIELFASSRYADRIEDIAALYDIEKVLRGEPTSAPDTNPMRITYDRKADAMSILLSDAPIKETTPVNEYVNVDYTGDDMPVAIELLNVSQFADDVDQLVELYDINKVLHKD